MDRINTSLTDFQRGLIFVAIGTFALLFTLGWLGRMFDVVMLIVSIIAIGYGLLLAKIPQTAVQYLNKLTKK